MALLTGTDSYPLRMETLDIGQLLFGDITTHKSTSVVIDLGGGQREYFTGFNFRFDRDDIPISGTITGLEERIGSVTSFKATGFETDVAQFVYWARTYDTGSALRSIFSHDDTMAGTSNDDVMAAFAGHDVVYGGAGGDGLAGGDGNDHVYGQSASGGPDGADYILGEGGSDYLQGNAGNDSIDGGDGSDRIQGGRDDDTIVGGSGNDTINGNLGTDTIDGQDGDDSLRGGQGNDIVAGGNGNDVLSGDLGVDTLTGGADADIFVFAGQGSTVSGGPDRVTDYIDSVDHLSIGYFPAAVLTGATQNSLSAAATTAQQLFDGHAGDKEVAALMVGGDTYLFYSSNGGAAADSAVLVVGVAQGAFTAQDFA